MNERIFDAVMKVADRPEIIFEKGKGSWLWDRKGNKYLDFIQGWAVNTLGHCPGVVKDALNEQMDKLINSSPAFYNQPMLECANTLISNSVFDQVFFANSGAEANEGAIKLARKWGSVHKKGSWKIITFDNSFHGRTLTTMAASGKPLFQPLFEPKTDGFIKVPFNDLLAVEQIIDDETVAIMLEPIQGEAGIFSADLSFIQGLRKLADKYQLLLIFDEIQTGVARTGRMFSYESYRVEPDILTLGKGLGGGIPISALLAKKFCCLFEFGDQGGTFNGNPLVTAVANNVLCEVLKPGFLEGVLLRSNELKESLFHLSNKFNMGEVRGEGLLVALETGDLDASRISEKAFDKGLLINSPRKNVIRFMPALNVTSEEIVVMIGVLTDVIKDSFPELEVAS